MSNCILHRREWVETVLCLSRVAVRLFGQVKSQAVLCPRLECGYMVCVGRAAVGRDRGVRIGPGVSVGVEGGERRNHRPSALLGCLGDRGMGEERREKWQSGLSGF